MFDLKDKVAVVTGGNGGIGLGMARGLAAAGASVVVAARDQAKSRAAVAELNRLGPSALAIAVDVSRRGLGDGAGRRHAPSGAAGSTSSSTTPASTSASRRTSSSLSEWHRVLDTNLTSAFLCARAVYPVMKAAGGGKIINVGSMMSIFGASFAPAYGASKGGIVQLTKSLATAWARDNIQVNAVLPGWIDTELTRRARQEVSGLHESVLRRTPAGRWGAIDDHRRGGGLPGQRGLRLRHRRPPSPWTAATPFRGDGPGGGCDWGVSTDF